MIDLEDELAEEFLAECRVHLTHIEADLIGIEGGGAGFEGSVNRIVAALHAIEHGASSLDLTEIRELANQTEIALEPIRSGKMALTPERISALLLATDKLHDLTRETRVPSMKLKTENPVPEQLRILLVEDDFASRLLLQTFLSRYGECHVAVNGREAIEAFYSTLEQGRKYDLICMDIMMPEMDGREAVGHVRTLEEARGIPSTSGAKIIMTTAVTDIREVGQCFGNLCDAYLTKPVDLAKLLTQMRSWRLVR
jgi:two-component system chemotaxis response regulator CheY